MTELPLPARLYIAALTLFVLGLAVRLLATDQPLGPGTRVVPIAGLVLMTIAGLYPLSLSFKRKLLLDTSVLIILILLLPPGVAMVVAGAGTLLAHAIRRDDVIEAIFNTAQIMLQAATGALILQAIEGGAYHDSIAPESIGPALIAGAAMYLVTNLSVATMVALQSDMSPIHLWRQVIVQTSPVELLGQVTQVGLGVAAAVLFRDIPWLLPILVLPTIGIYAAIRRTILLRRRAEAARRGGNADLAKAQRAARLGSWEWNLSTGDQIWSEETYHLLGLTRPDFGPSYQMLLHAVDPSDRAAVNRAVHDALRDGAPFGIAHHIRLPDGTLRSVQQRGNVVRDEAGRKTRLVATVQDVTDRTSRGAQTIHQAVNDPLAGLPNRAQLVDHLAQVLGSNGHHPPPVTVLAVELDGFKSVNGGLGHEAGDRALAEVGRRLRASLRPGDVAARFGSDRFVIVLGSGTDEDATAIAQTIHESLRAPITLNGHKTTIDASIGIAFAGPALNRPSDLLHAANTALCRAKAKGSGKPVIFERGTLARPATQPLLEEDVRVAIERNELQLHYQPEVDLATGAIVGIEALIRWRRPGGTWLLPGDFLSLANETDLIVPIGRWVLAEACRQARSWQSLMGRTNRLTIGVNVSVREFHEPSFVATVATILEESGLDGFQLGLELIEPVLVENLDAARRTLDELRKMGIRLTMDNVGAGYSSLSDLHRVSVDALKIDRSLVSRLEIDEADRAILQATSSLAHTFGVDVTAVGVETPEQLAWAGALGCDRGQGYFFAPPLSAWQLTELLAAGPAFDGFPPATPRTDALTTDERTAALVRLPIDKRSCRQHDSDLADIPILGNGRAASALEGT